MLKMEAEIQWMGNVNLCSEVMITNDTPERTET